MTKDFLLKFLKISQKDIYIKKRVSMHTFCFVDDSNIVYNLCVEVHI